MKKTIRPSWLVLLSVLSFAMIACGSDDEQEPTTKPTSEEDRDYIYFTAHTPNSLKESGSAGFGVFSYYVNDSLYAQDNTPPTFMYNQQVKYSGAEWQYEPLGTWKGYLSFFAYAPWKKISPSWANPADDAESEKNITYVSTNKDTADPIIKYVVDTNPTTSVDLMWGVATTDGYTTNTGENLSYVKAGKPYLNITSPQSSADKLDFTFRHALAKLNVTIDYNDKYGDIETLKRTKVFVREVTIGGFVMQGALNLNNRKANIPNWKAYDGISDLEYTNGVTFRDGRIDGKEGTVDGASANEKYLGLNHTIIQSTPYETETDENGNTIFASSWNQANPGVTTKTVNLFNSEDVNAPIYVIPLENEDIFMGIRYDVEIIDPKLTGKLSDKVTNGALIGNAYQITIHWGVGSEVKMQAGKEYTINLHLPGWDDATGTVKDWTE